MSTVSESLTLFLCGDVMAGRGIDQILPRPCPPRLYEGYVQDARRYVELAERANGPIPRPVDFAYVWGDALEELTRAAPDLRIVNLETAVTDCPEWAPKGINYRMHPANVPVLTAARLDCCVLANNHVLDWGRGGLEETLARLRAAGIQTAGAGRDAHEARAPAVLRACSGHGRVLVFAVGTADSGIPMAWAARRDRAGVAVLKRPSAQAADALAARVAACRRPGDRVVVSVHWGGNWGYGIDPEQMRFAHRLVDAGAADVVHGHSSHHVKGIEVYRDRPVLYGCGDFLNDYEGIVGHERYRGDLGLMYFVTLDRRSGRLRRLELTPTRVARMRIQRAAPDEARWLAHTLQRESEPFGVRVTTARDGRLAVHWKPAPPDGPGP